MEKITKSEIKNFIKDIYGYEGDNNEVYVNILYENCKNLTSLKEVKYFISTHPMVWSNGVAYLFNGEIENNK